MCRGSYVPAVNFFTVLSADRTSRTLVTRSSFIVSAETPCSVSSPTIVALALTKSVPAAAKSLAVGDLPARWAVSARRAADLLQRAVVDRLVVDQLPTVTLDRFLEEDAADGRRAVDDDRCGRGL